MEYRRFADTYVVRLDRGDEVIQSLTELCEVEQIALGEITGLGAADHAVVGLYHVADRRYQKQELSGPMEITSLVGNISQKDGAVYLHIHINLCNEKMQVYGGHLNACRISATGEFMVRRIEGSVGRRLDLKETGLNLYLFDENKKQ